MRNIILELSSILSLIWSSEFCTIFLGLTVTVHDESTDQIAQNVHAGLDFSVQPADFSVLQ